MLIAVHAVLSMLTPAFSRFLKSRTFYLLALAPLAAGLWLVSVAPTVLAGGVIRQDFSWIPMLGVDISHRLGLVQWVLAMIVSWVGALVLLFCRWYFSARFPARSAALLLAFAGAMLGLVTADDLVMLYVYWELTTVLSYLLIGHDPTRRANRGAAHTALIVTTFGGLVMLLGIIGLGYRAGSFSLAEILSDPPTGPLVTASVLAMLVGAMSKSAMVPFHFWLPGAMAAPTPISAYLHAAAMVKAGVYLVAVLSPVFAGIPFWRPTVMVLGSVTMILGGLRALRQKDLKLLLAYGTVSQLGFMILLVGLGSQTAALAGMAVVISHALFKSALFLLVGIIDQAAGTRDMDELNGVMYRAPVLAVGGALAVMSMAGLPPTVGFIAKEAAFESLNYLVLGDAGVVTPLAGMAFAVAVVFGSVITVAYSLRWWWGAFAPKRTDVVLNWKAPPALKLGIPALLALLGLVGGFMGEELTAVLRPYAASHSTGVPGHGLALWHGFGWPLLMTTVAVGLGVAFFAFREQISAVQATFPKIRTAEETYHRGLRSLDRVAVEVTARSQSGSLSVYLGIILVTLVSLATFAMLRIRVWPSYRIFDDWAQLIVAAVVASAGVLAAWSRGRIRAVVLVGVTGYGLALLFAMHGAPDLALTQALVETVTLVVFILVLRKMPRYFTNRPLTSTRWWRVVVAVAAGLTATLTALVGIGARVAEPVSLRWPEAAYEYGYGKNVVNVALVDIRAWDTLGEISVLVIAATGVASLIFLRSRVGVLSSTADALAARDQELQADSNPGVWLRAGQTLHPAVRSLVFEVIVRILFGVVMVVSVYLLFAGHNRPGGGFAGGLVAGMALVLRYLAAGRHELDEAIPFDAGRLLGAGLFCALLAAISPLFVGGVVLQSFEVTVNLPGPDVWVLPWGAELPMFGELHVVSSTLFDIGVYLVVVGVMLDLVRSLGSGIDMQSDSDDAPTPLPLSAKALPAKGNR
nr:Na+/H+ antiporter subunit A [Tessaracoccus sp. OS52]